MFAVKYPDKKNDDNRIYICKAYSIKGKKKKKIIERYESEKALGKNQEERNAFVEARIKALEDGESELKSQRVTVEYDPSVKADGEIHEIKNLGMLFLQKAWSDLKIEQFLYKWTASEKLRIKYSLNDALRLMSYARVIDPGSKLFTSKQARDRYVEPFDVSIDDLYDSLDRIPLFEGKLTRRIAKAMAKEFGKESTVVYYDCTNLYFEIQFEDDIDGLRAYGYEKNHRPDPIVEYGLLYDESGFPIASASFRGDESEKNSLIPLLKSAGEEMSKAKIICADAGLNTEENKKTIHNSGRNYIFSQGVKGLSDKKAGDDLESLREWATNGKGMAPVSPSDPKSASCKERWIVRTSGFSERLVVKFDPGSRKMMLKTIEKRLERANDIIKHPKDYSFSKCQDGKQYIEKIATDRKTGEIIEKDSVLVLKTDSIEREKREAGYYCFVTDIPNGKDKDAREIEEMARDGLRYVPLPASEILSIGGRRVEIEDCFRIMKTNLEARPVNVRTPDHIRSHLFVVYLALALMSYIKLEYKIAATNEELFAAIGGFACAANGNGMYEIKEKSEVATKLIAATGLTGLEYKVITNVGMRAIITRSKNR